MSAAEVAEVDRLWKAARTGNLSRASIIERIARGNDPVTGEVQIVESDNAT